MGNAALKTSGGWVTGRVATGIPGCFHLGRVLGGNHDLHRRSGPHRIASTWAEEGQLRGGQGQAEGHCDVAASRDRCVTVSDHFAYPPWMDIAAQSRETLGSMVNLISRLRNSGFFTTFAEKYFVLD